MTVQNTRRFDALTGVRILAAGGVFLSHLPRPEFLPASVKTFMGSGYNGVTLFFILSGFVLAWSYTDRILPLKPMGLWSFFVARFARIYPMYLLALLVVILPRIMNGKSDSLMLVHALALQPWLPKVEQVYVYNAPGWSIGVELFLYACFPVLILALSKLRKNTVALLVTGFAVVAAVFALTWWFVVTGRADLPVTHAESAHRWLYRMPATRLGDFAVGIIAALLVRDYMAPGWLSRSAQIIGAGSILALMCTPQLISTAWSWDAAYIVPAALLLWGLAAGPGTFLARVLATKPMVLFGEASFAFYLLHRPLVDSLAIPAGGGRAWIVATAITFGLILLMAVGAHMVIERPAQQWLRRTFNKISTRRPELAQQGLGGLNDRGATDATRRRAVP